MIGIFGNYCGNNTFMRRYLILVQTNMAAPKSADQTLQLNENIDWGQIDA